MPPVIYALRGLPGSGKSTVAKRFDAVRVNRDDLRQSLFNGQGILAPDQENLITKVQRQTAVLALQSGKDVVVDDMNLRSRYLREWNTLAVEHGAAFEVVLVDTDVETCVKRDAQRERHVGEKVIRDLDKRFMPNGEFPTYTPFTEVPKSAEVWERATFDPSLPHTIIVDIDGTMTLGPHDRSPFEWTKVGQDQPRRAVVNLVNRLLRDGYLVTFMSGRDEVCRYETQAWLAKHVDSDHHDQCVLHMRGYGDTRKDDIVKYELFNKHVRGRFNVKFVLDDRDQVVDMWRAIGLTCFQVDYGDF